MKKSTLRSSLLFITILIFGQGCVDRPTPTAQPFFDLTRGATFVQNGNPALSQPDVKSALTIVDYSSWPTTEAVALADADPNTGTVTPDTPPADAGTVVFAFTQMLDGTTIATANPVLLSGQPIKVGQGDHAGQFNQILNYSALPGVVAYVATSHTTPSIDNSIVMPIYRPDGGWQIDPAETIDKAPPPAIVVTPLINSGSFSPGDTVIIHLLAVVKGTSGVLVDQAIGAAGPIFLTVPNSPRLPVAASVVFTVP